VVSTVPAANDGGTEGQDEPQLTPSTFCERLTRIGDPMSQMILRLPPSIKT